MTDVAPTPSVAPLEGAVTREQAGPMLEQLRTDRIAGRVTESDYLARADYLGRLDAGEDVQAPNLRPTMDQRFEQQYADVMRGAEPHEYQIRYAGAELNDEQRELDTEVRLALSDAKIPAHLGASIVERIDSIGAGYARMSPADRETKLESFRFELRGRWGDQYQARTDAIADLVATATAKHEYLGELIDAAPFIIADVRVVEWLWQVIEYKQQGK